MGSTSLGAQTILFLGISTWEHYKITLVFRVKAQSGAMGNITQWSPWSRIRCWKEKIFRICWQMMPSFLHSNIQTHTLRSLRSLAVRFFGLVEMSTWWAETVKHGKNHSFANTCWGNDLHISPTREIPYSCFLLVFGSQQLLFVYMPQICIVVSVVPWRFPLGDNRNFDWCVRDISHYKG